MSLRLGQKLTLKAMVYNLKVRKTNQVENCVRRDPKSFWYFVKSSTGDKSLPDTVQAYDIDISGDNNMAQAFNEYFHSVFNDKERQVLDDFNSYTVPELSHIEFTQQDILSVLNGLAVNRPLAQMV